MTDHFSGHHCESTALVNMLRGRDIRLSEPMVFGLGQGLSFLYWHSKQMPGPFLGGRVKPDHLMRNATTALGIGLQEQQTASRAKAEKDLLAALDEGDVVGLKLDRYHLDYADDRHHFAAHYLACVGYDDDSFTVVETGSLGVLTTSRQSMGDARAAKGPMSSRNLSFRITADGWDPDTLPAACRAAIRATARDFLRPPITNMGFKGITKTSTLMRGWCDTLDDPAHAMGLIGDSMEKGGTGGGFFRTLWADFLDEAAVLTDDRTCAAVADRYRRMSARWTEVAGLLRGAGDSCARTSAETAAALVADLAVEERAAMTDLEAVPA